MGAIDFFYEYRRIKDIYIFVESKELHAGCGTTLYRTIHRNQPY
jgi:hypothetical protein